LTQFSHRVAGAYPDEAVLSRLLQVLVDGTGAVEATLWLSGREQAAATWPGTSLPLDDLRGDRIILVQHQGQTLGRFTLKKRRGEPFTPIEEKLLSDLAAQAGQVLLNARLASDLQARVQQVTRQSAELRASRQRIVAAQDAERRRLERNIHDGAQQHLVALAVKLRLAATLARRDREQARRAIGELRSQTSEALTAIRQLAQGIYPEALRIGGLVQALRQSAAVEADGVGRYDPEIEAAVYFCCLEALQNAAKYANASETRVALRQANGELRFEVRDNGVGFDPNTAALGRGLQNMQDRIGSLGGSVRLESARGRGTVVAGVLPLRAAEPVSVTA
jgi:signal transduction histidine kinase